MVKPLCTRLPMPDEDVIAWLEGIVFGGVAITTAALQYATDGEGLTFPQWRAILLVGGSDDGCRVGEVAGFLHAALPATSRLLRRLERRGLLTLERDEQDRRATRAQLTRTGADLRQSVLRYRRDELGSIADEVRVPSSAHRVLRDLAASFEGRGHADSDAGPRQRTGA